MATFAVSGSFGFVGGTLCETLTADGHQVVRIVRDGRGGTGTAQWNPATGDLESGPFAGVDAIVHLAGENMFGRWSQAKKQRIRDSRQLGTQSLCRGLAKLPSKPKVLVSASAVGIYGDRGAEALDERSGPGTGFLADVCEGWEAATTAAHNAGIRVVHLRFGVVLGKRGGALQKMLLPFRLGLGGPIGSGRQFISWIAMPDLIAAIRFVAEREDLAGPFNAVSPEPAANRDLARSLGRALRRPTFLPFPAFAARLVFGEMASETMLASQRVLPRRLLMEGFQFAHPKLDSALATILA